jgi:hypothetical protein
MGTPGEKTRQAHTGSCIRWANLCAIILLFPLLPGCAYLDFGWDDKTSWDFKPFWDTGITIGEEDPENPGYDKDGNKIPSPEVLATYTFPDVTAGMHVLIGRDARITPTVGMEMFETKLGPTRWWSGQFFGGNQVAGFGLYKRWTSIYEITTGPFVCWDFEARGLNYGVGFTLIKF